MKDFTTFLKVATVVLMGVGVACGGGEAPMPESEPMEEAAPAAEPEPEPMSSEPRVFFVTPEDGAEISVDIPLAFEFGIENYEIAPVPETVETPRPGVGHYHIGIDAECLPVGEIIPQSDPWVHFGDGSNTFETLLEPGEHTFALQLGDDEHRTLEGLCETITVELAEGI